VTKRELGSIGAAVNPGAGMSFVDAAVALEALGYSTIWLTGGALEDLGQIADVVGATRQARIASGIVSVDRFPSAAVSELYCALETHHPDRFVVGLGGAHGPKPLQTIADYLDRLTAVPLRARVLAALGPRMLGLARERAAGAFPVLVSPEYTARARTVVGDDITLAIDQLVVLEPDAARARETARRGPLGFLGKLPGYVASFRRMGFSEAEIVSLDDGLVDAVVAWGSVDAIAARVREHFQAGADHVAVSPIATPPGASALDVWRRLAPALIGT
jgi:probable F420-dependent oxidoreductase